MLAVVVRYGRISLELSGNYSISRIINEIITGYSITAINLFVYTLFYFILSIDRSHYWLCKRKTVIYDRRDEIKRSQHGSLESDTETIATE